MIINFTKLKMRDILYHLLKCLKYIFTSFITYSFRHLINTHSGLRLPRQYILIVCINRFGNSRFNFIVNPAAPALKWISWERNALICLFTIQSLPIHPGALHIQLTKHAKLFYHD
ncbi:hypothetical protein D3C78_1009590 [compost metagenome]